MTRSSQLAKLCLAMLCLVVAPARAEGYRLGHGYDVGPVNFAGYSNVAASLPDHGKKSLILDDLSLFASGHVAKLINPFVEAELTRFDILHTGSNGMSSLGDGDGDFVLERLYNDSYLTDSVTLRLGKMLAPVGEWNQIHAAPLVLTSVRPAVTYRNFSEYVTGVSLLYNDTTGYLPDIQLYWQPDGELTERPSRLAFHHYRRVAGVRLSVPFGLLDKVGVSFQTSQDVRGVDQSLFGADFHYTLGKLTLQGEGTVSDVAHDSAPRARDLEWGLYGAAAYALTRQWSVFSWYEGFAGRAAQSPAHDILAGFAYRPHPAIVLKLEYLKNFGGPPVNPTGLFASWSVLF